MRMRFYIRALAFLISSYVCLGAPFKIGVILKDKTPGFWVYAEMGVNDAAKALGADVHVSATPTVMETGARFRLLA